MKRNNYQLHLIIISLIAFSSSINLHGQLVGWQYKDAISIQENSGSQKLNYQVLFTINTAALVTSGRMLASGDDLRFAKTCNGSVLYNYWIESGMNTATTQIWVLIDTLAASGTRIMNIYYGNNAATAASDFNTTFPNQKIVGTAEAVTDTVWNFDWVEIQSGATATLAQSTFPNRLTINARKIKISGTLDGSGSGYQGGVGASGTGTNGAAGGGPGGGQQTTSCCVSGGGGGYGGQGGDGRYSTCCGLGGPAYGNASTMDIQAGSGGAAGSMDAGYIAGGNGGARITFNAAVVEIGGTFKVNGADGLNSGLLSSGAGAGGGILIKANVVSISGTGLLSAKGGRGGNASISGYGGGGGGGGRIKIFYHVNYNNAGTNDVSGGLQGTGTTGGGGGTPGAFGSFYNGTYVSGVPTYTILPHVALSVSADPVCPGAAVTFTSTTPFSNYNFYVNGSSVQSSAVNTYSSSSITNNAAVKVLATYAGSCIDTSNIITMTVYPAPPVNLGADTIICTIDQLTLDAGNFPGYIWQDNSTASTFVVDGASLGAGNYTFYVDVVDANGCNGTDTITISVIVCSTSISEYGAMEVSVSPNPTGGIFNISVVNPGADKIQLEMMTVDGKIAYAGSITKMAGEQVDVSNLSKGIYILKISNGKEIIVQKIVLK